MNVRDIICKECGAAAGEGCRGVKRTRKRGRSWHHSRAQAVLALRAAGLAGTRALRERIADYNRGVMA